MHSNAHLEIVIVKPQPLPPVSGTTDIYSPGSLSGCNDFGHDQICKPKMANMVRSKLRFESIFCRRIRHRHDGSIVDEPVDRFTIFVDLLSGFANLLLGAEVEFEQADLRARRGGPYGARCSLEFGPIVTGQNDDVGVLAAELQGDLSAKAALRDAGYEDCAVVRE